MDFDGGYTIVEVGCGAGCIYLAAVDARTGRVSWFPCSVSNWPTNITEPADYKVDSALVVLYGQLNENGSAGPHYFRFDGKRYQAVSISTERH